MKGTKKLYIIETCEQILYFNSISTTFSFNTTAVDGDWGWGTTSTPPQKKISSDSPRSMLFALPNFDQTMWFSLSFFRPDPKFWKFYPQFQTLQILHSSLKTWWVQLPKNMLLGCVLLKVYSLTDTLNAYSLYTVHISLYISLFQIREYSYIAYDNPF